MNRRLIVLLTALFAVVLFAGGAWYYDRSQKAAITAAVSTAEGQLIRSHSPIIGPVDARVTVVEFLDPSCEACRAFYPILKQIMAMYPDQIRIVVRYTPFHQGSEEAVRILEAARRQMKFDPVLYALFAKQPEWAVHGAPDLAKAWTFAEAAGLHIERARREAYLPEVTEVIQQDMADVKAFNVKGTPTFFVNGKPLTDFSAQGLLDLIEGEVKGGARP
ncbi:DsbA family protein [Lacibacterium aquatile]|uniref:DsbA family protein n=1 Tax=Lacibacterium aquatile TaxID=1168082 RepID=A0ABW5DR28_9PROT